MASAVTGGVRARGDRIVYRPGRLADGEHTVEVTRGGGMGAALCELDIHGRHEGAGDPRHEGDT